MELNPRETRAVYGGQGEATKKVKGEEGEPETPLRGGSIK